MLLYEPLNVFSIIGTVVVTAGASIIAGFGALDEPSHSLNELVALFTRHSFIIWSAIQGFTLCLLSLCACLLHRDVQKHRRQQFPGAEYSNSSKAITTYGIIFGCISGILSAHTLLLAKTSVELVLRTVIDRINQFKHISAWVLVSSMLLIALIQLCALNIGLRHCSTSILYPLIFCVYNITSILDGLIYYEQGTRLSALQVCMVALGTVVLLVGVGCLSWRFAEDDSDDIDETLHPLLTSPVIDPESSCSDSSNSVKPFIKDLFPFNTKLRSGSISNPKSQQTTPNRLPARRVASNHSRLPTRRNEARRSTSRPLSQIEVGMVWDELLSDDDMNSKQIKNGG